MKWFARRTQPDPEPEAQRAITRQTDSVTSPGPADSSQSSDGMKRSGSLSSVSNASEQQVVNGVRKTYKQRVPLHVRMEQVAIIKAKFPMKVPIVVERFKKEKVLPPLDKTKFLVPQEVTGSQFITIIRNRMNVGTSQPMYLLVNNKALPSLAITAAELYSDYRDEDGFLYITYASQEIFGSGLLSRLRRLSSK